MIITGETEVRDGRQLITEVAGEVNVPTVQRYAHIRSAIRRGLPQVRGHAPNRQRICLVGSGPSLEASLPELRAAAWAGCPIVAMNGSYAWLIAHNIKPTSMVLVDGRAFNARFLTEQVPSCSYFLASQCAPEIFDRVSGWPNVFVWHCLTGADPDEKALLDDYYLHAWQPVSGGCTVGLRAIVLFRILGFVQLDLFGMDSCYLDDRGHAVDQPENAGDDRAVIYCTDQRFTCAAWHCAQALEFVDLIRAMGEHFALEVHGDGLLAHILRGGLEACADVTDQLAASKGA